MKKAIYLLFGLFILSSCSTVKTSKNKQKAYAIAEKYGAKFVIDKDSIISDEDLQRMEHLLKELDNAFKEPKTFKLVKSTKDSVYFDLRIPIAPFVPKTSTKKK